MYIPTSVLGFILGFIVAIIVFAVIGKHSINK